MVLRHSLILAEAHAAQVELRIAQQHILVQQLILERRDDEAAEGKKELQALEESLGRLQEQIRDIRRKLAAPQDQTG